MEAFSCQMIPFTFQTSVTRWRRGSLQEMGCFRPALTPLRHITCFHARALDIRWPEVLHIAGNGDLDRAPMLSAYSRREECCSKP